MTSQLDLTDEEKRALIGLLKRTLAEARYPYSRGYDPIKAILARLEPPQPGPLLPPLREELAPSVVGRGRRRR